MGTQWSGMGRDLMELKLFRQSIEKSSNLLKKYNIDLFKLILSSTPSDLDKPINSFVTIAAIQVALVDCLKTMGVEPDGIVGHSVGELGMKRKRDLQRVLSSKQFHCRLCLC
jgi:fatty acid synthase